MTVITYSKSTFAGNAKTRRHERRRKLAIERDTIGNIIDSIFGCDATDTAKEESRKLANRVDRATSLGSLRDRNTGGSACLPDVAIYAAGYRNSKQVTAR